MDYQKRIAKLQEKLRRKKVDGLLVTKPENRRYLCGYRGGDHGINETSGMLLVPASGKVHLLTDFRFKLQAEQESPGAEVVIYKKGVLRLLGQLLPDLAVTSLAFESNYTLHSFADRMTTTLTKNGMKIVPTDGLVETMREIKDEEEISLIRSAVRLNEEVFAEIHSTLADFPTEIDIALAIETSMRRKGAERPSFDTIVASGKNGALPHAVPGSSPVEKDGSLTIDMGLILDGYCSDMTRNLVVGKPSKRYLELHRLVRKAQLAGIAAVRAGVRVCDADKAARDVIVDAGYGSYFGHSLGHGVGLAVHEEPRLSSRSNKKLKADMIVTVEPGIYIPGWGGIRLENMFVVREDGCENLNNDSTWLDI
ncbi:MAG: Xaa-Pro peptidase family protein [Proteobacteria bacterium]|nr:Xaa-Pro peptidase family protein [Pseudomonadota bacterium]